MRQFLLSIPDDLIEPARTVTAGPDGTVSIDVDLPMPGIAYLQIT